MKNLWNNKEAESFKGDLGLRVYTSNLQGRSDELVLHGGGNTSVKLQINGEDILYVKGSGWDLVSIKEEGFAPVRLNTLQKMARLESLSDSDMVAKQKAAMTNTTAPNPSIEAILHAIIPYKYVDHTHANAVVTISNNKNGLKHIKTLFPNFLIIPYVMPGFYLAKTIFEMTKDFSWDTCGGIILHNHGIFTFDDNAQNSYNKMIQAVNKAEQFLEENASFELKEISPKPYDIKRLQQLISESKGFEVFIKSNQSPLALHYASMEKVLLTRGVLTPEHIIRTKRHPLVLKDDKIENALTEYKKEYQNYFETFKKNETMLNSTPNYAVIENYGIVSFGKNEKEANIINDIVTHTMHAVLKADRLGGYESISLQDSFSMEYWELEQAKLKK